MIKPGPAIHKKPWRTSFGPSVIFTPETVTVLEVLGDYVWLETDGLLPKWRTKYVAPVKEIEQ